MKQSTILIGDVHGKYDQYLDIIQNHPYSIQLGDFGFSYNILFGGILSPIDEKKHKIISGNHDNYDDLPPHSLGNYGVGSLNSFDFFFIRGAYSVDKMYRTIGISWWEQEELSYKQGCDCIKLFGGVQPQIVLSHDCPNVCITNGVLTNFDKEITSNTGYLLQQCWEKWQPKYWIFAHHHNSWRKKIEQKDFGQTEFICLNELEILNVEELIDD